VLKLNRIQKKFRWYQQHTRAGDRDDTQSEGFVGRRPNVLSCRSSGINCGNAYTEIRLFWFTNHVTHLPYTKTHGSKVESNKEQLGSKSINPGVLKWFKNCKKKKFLKKAQCFDCMDIKVITVLV
jgi:hypothetical protein